MQNLDGREARVKQSIYNVVTEKKAIDAAHDEALELNTYWDEEDPREDAAEVEGLLKDEAEAAAGENEALLLEKNYRRGSQWAVNEMHESRKEERMTPKGIKAAFDKVAVAYESLQFETEQNGSFYQMAWYAHQLEEKAAEFKAAMTAEEEKRRRQINEAS